MHNKPSLEKTNSYIKDINVSALYDALSAQRVLAETLGEIKAEQVDEVENAINSIFKQWQYEHGVYPPRPSMLLRAVHKARHNTDYPVPESFRVYASGLSEEQAALIMPWQCCEGARFPIALFCKLIEENYEPLMAYVYGKSSPRFDHMFAVVVSMSIQSVQKGDTDLVLSWARKLFEIRDRSHRPFLDKENNRKQARSKKGEEQKRAMMARVKEKLVELAEKPCGLPKNLQETLANMAGTTQSNVSKALKALKEIDEEVVAILAKRS